MKLLLLDFEATGIDPYKARPIEYCFLLITLENGSRSEQIMSGYLWDKDYVEIPEEVTKITRITTEKCRSEGKHPKEIFQALADSIPKVDFLVAHNAAMYDKPLMESEMKRHGIAIPESKWIDTRTDLPYPERLKCRVLSHIALEHGIMIDPSKLHGAEADVNIMADILFRYNIEEIIKMVQTPFVVLQAMVTYDNREKAKAKGFSWEKLEPKIFPKSWVKKVRQTQVEEEKAKADFNIKELGVF